MSSEVSFFDYSETIKTPVFLVECTTPEQNKLFRDTINKYHSYVKYKDSPTRNLRWLIYETKSGNHIGAIGLSSATIAISCRDEYIGWKRNNELRILEC
jgi:hypothetical protein